MRSPTPGTGLARTLNVLFGTLLGKERKRDTTLGLRAEVIPRRTRQLHDLVGLVVSQLGFVKLLGRFVQRSNARLFRVFLALIASGSLVHPLNVTLEWEPSTETNVVGYVLYQGVAGTGYIKATDVGNQTSATVTNLVCGITNFFCIAAYDADRIEGNPSNLIGTNCPGP